MAGEGDIEAGAGALRRAFAAARRAPGKPPAMSYEDVARIVLEAANRERSPRVEAFNRIAGVLGDLPIAGEMPPPESILRAWGEGLSKIAKIVAEVRD